MKSRGRRRSERGLELDIRVRYRGEQCGTAINRACNRTPDTHPGRYMQIRSDTVLEIRRGPPRPPTMRDSIDNRK